MNRPSVTIVNGSVSSSASGRTTAFTRPSSSAAAINVGVPVIVMPGTITLATQSANALIAMRSSNPGIGGA